MEVRPQRLDRWDTAHSSEGEAETEEGDRAATSPLSGHRCRRQPRYREVRPVGNACNKTGNDQHWIRRRNRRQTVANHQPSRQQQEKTTPRQLTRQCCDQRCTNHYAQSISRNNTAGLIFGNRKIISDQTQQAHRHKLGDTNSKPTQS